MYSKCGYFPWGRGRSSGYGFIIIIFHQDFADKIDLMSHAWCKWQMTVVLKQFSCRRKMTTLHCTYLTNCIICNVDMFYLIFNILTSHWPPSVCRPVLAVLTRCWLQEVFWSAAAAGPGEASIWQDRKKFGKHRIPHSDADSVYSEYNQWILLISTHAGLELWF